METETPGAEGLVPDSQDRVTPSPPKTKPIPRVTNTLTEVRFQRTGYVAVMNRCVISCQLCQVLGCLHDDERSFDSSLDTLNRLADAKLCSVTFPPNTILYPHRERLLESALHLKLKPVLRIHPAVGVHVHADVIADWIFQGGEIEAVVDAPWNGKDLAFLERLDSVVDGRLRALIVPNRKHGLLQLIDSISGSLAKTAEVYYPQSDNELFLTCDEVFAELAAARSQRPGFEIRPARAFDRPGPEVPSWFETEPEAEPQLKSTSLNPTPQISVVIVSLNQKETLINTLRHLQRQDLNPNIFEVVIIDDGSEDGTFARIRDHLVRSPMRFNLRYYTLPRPHARRSGDGLVRNGIARNFGVRKTTGATVVFLDPNTLVSTDFLSDIQRHHAEFDVLQYERIQIPFYKSSQRPRYQDLDPKRDGMRSENGKWERVYSATDWAELPGHWKYISAACLVVRRAHFNAVGGFARSFRSYGMEDMFLGWQLAQSKLKWKLRRKPVFHLLSDSDAFEHGNSILRKLTVKARSAQNFYLLTLDEEFYRAFFPLMGNHTHLRIAMDFVSRSKAGRALLSIVLTVVGSIRRRA